MAEIDLQAYLERIGYRGRIAPDLETLRALHLAQATTFVFENLSSWSGRRVSLELADIETKLIRGGRGGYCFECNSLFAAALRQIGFEVIPLMARVLWMQPPGSLPPRSHMLLRVNIAGRSWIADVGFGAIGQTSPLALDTEEEQATPHEPRRFRFENGFITQQVRLGEDEWADVYRFDLQEAHPADFEMANWFVSTHPESLFRKTLLVTQPRPDHRLTIAFGEFTKRFLDGRAEKRPVLDDADLRDLLVREFRLPADDPAVREATLAPPGSVGTAEFRRALPLAAR